MFFTPKDYHDATNMFKKNTHCITILFLLVMWILHNKKAAEQHTILLLKDLRIKQKPANIEKVCLETFKNKDISARM